MWIVQLALRRPYTFVIMSMLIVILGVIAILRMPTDIQKMAEAVTVRSERGFTGSVNDIQHIAFHPRAHRGPSLMRTETIPSLQVRSGWRMGAPRRRSSL